MARNIVYLHVYLRIYLSVYSGVLKGIYLNIVGIQFGKYSVVEVYSMCIYLYLVDIALNILTIHLFTGH